MIHKQTNDTTIKEMQKGVCEDLGLEENKTKKSLAR